MKSPNPNATANSLFAIGDADSKSQGSQFGKKKKIKKKKKKEVDPIANDLFFEGGTETEILPEYVSMGTEEAQSEFS